MKRVRIDLDTLGTQYGLTPPIAARVIFLDGGRLVLELNTSGPDLVTKTPSEEQS